MGNFNFKKYFAEGKLLKEISQLPPLETGYDLISWLDSIPEFKPYRNTEASYDELYYEIPTNVFNKVTGLTQGDVEKINQNLEVYTGRISWNETNPNKYKEHTVLVSGGA
jgi:hypothetical protein